MVNASRETMDGTKIEAYGDELHKALESLSQYFAHEL